MVQGETEKSRGQKRGITDKGWLEKGLRTAEPLIANGDNLPIRKFIALLQRGRGGSSGHLILKVQCDIAQLLLDITDNFSFSCIRWVASVNWLFPCKTFMLPFPPVHNKKSVFYILS